MIFLASVNLGGVECEARVRVTTDYGDYECDFAAYHAYADGCLKPIANIPESAQNALLEEACDRFNWDDNGDFEYDRMRDAV